MYTSMNHAFKGTYFMIKCLKMVYFFPLITCRSLHAVYLTESLENLPKYFGDVCMLIQA